MADASAAGPSRDLMLVSQLSQKNTRVVPACVPRPDCDASAPRVQQSIKGLASTFTELPSIFKRHKAGADVAQELGVQVADWAELRRRRELDLLQAYGNGNMQPSFVPNQGIGGLVTRFEAYERPGLRPIAKILKTSKAKTGGSGRTYTSKYRGVHQTFPTRRWEAQFRRNGKPTSLGCFDHEEEAAKAYDKMMLWCELHNAAGVKGGITNFDPAEYTKDVQWLQQVTQDELVQILRSDGRRQAQQRTQKQRRDPSLGPGGTLRSEQASGNSSEGHTDA